MEQSPPTSTTLPARTVLLLTMLLSFSWHLTAAPASPTECCYSYAQKRIRHVQSFYRTSSDCSLPAVVFVAANGDEICVDPKNTWVKKVIKILSPHSVSTIPPTHRVLRDLEGADGTHGTHGK
ncbi:PREDICTED: C-C motif chemokine 3-like, partial [Chaetura pelagica]|uniref:C-C motif chemokine 3-like n=1 Tax=Chaetura pelagica TaxID=8897 RepID=UPI0005235FBC